MSFEYKYPDKNDEITSALIEEIEPYPNYWVESEELVIAKIRRIVNKIGRKLRILDAGCGIGRLIPKFNQYAYEYIAIEPDIDRFNDTKAFIEKESLNNVLIKNCSIEEISDVERFDIIICSHVIQHINDNIVTNIMNKFNIILNDEGFVFLTTCFARGSVDYYTKVDKNKSIIQEIIISNEEFNNLTNGSNVLPVHFYSLNMLREITSKSGFLITHVHVYHNNNIFLRILKCVQIDIFINKIKSIQEKSGRDILICFAKTRK